ncbi:MAG TPA: aromatic ring-hydroxylating dioxygenase subunit alpha [Burkholderiales bacterium]|nr:aromatic ring-hydroxylating dioxygenase subunit alpha [Burkholderiales bacterium]
MYLRNCWQVAAFGTEIIAGQMLARKICDEPLVFFRAKDGHVVAFEDRCPHRYAPLSKGFLIDDTVRCGYHGLTYDITGKCIYIPGQDRIPPKAKVKVYPTVERYRCVWIWMGEAERADANLVPDVHWMDHPEWAASEGYHHVEANYRLLNDNLLDLSHETYVHGKTIGHDAVAEEPFTIRVDEKSVYIDKEMPNCTAPPFYQYLARVSPKERINRWQRTVYIPPGYIVIDVGVEPVEPRPPAIRFEGRVIDLITPETPVSSHYFWGFARNARIDEPAVTEFTRENVRRTFDEDKEMLEAQQRIIGAETEPAFQVAIKADAGPTQGRRLLASMIEAEARGG